MTKTKITLKKLLKKVFNKHVYSNISRQILFKTKDAQIYFYLILILDILRNNYNLNLFKVLGSLY